MSAPPEARAGVPDDWVETLDRFWFDEHGRSDWFGGGPAFDEAVRARFGGWLEPLCQQPVEAFTVGALTALSAILLFDQVPRNIHRGTPAAFATDTKALAIARAAVERDYDAALDVDRRLFLYLPFEHSEALADQDRAVALISALGDADYTAYAIAHRDVIARFGRFPHRNAVLGRADAPGEAEAVAAGAAF